MARCPAVDAAIEAWLCRLARLFPHCTLASLGDPRGPRDPAAQERRQVDALDAGRLLDGLEPLERRVLVMRHANFDGVQWSASIVVDVLESGQPVVVREERRAKLTDMEIGKLLGLSTGKIAALLREARRKIAANLGAA